MRFRCTSGRTQPSQSDVYQVKTRWMNGVHLSAAPPTGGWFFITGCLPIRLVILAPRRIERI